MGSINKNHNETDGGVLLFNGELILIYCDGVTIEIGGKESSKGRIYLTTHRIVFVATPMKPNIMVKSVSAPFFALSDINLEQPVFGANYISARVRDESDQSQSFTFKLKFSKGGAIEFGMAMSKAANAVSQLSPPSQPPPPYTPNPATTQYYQAPPTVYAPGYNCGFQLPQSQAFNQPGTTPIGFIYASPDPPPYPGMGGQPNQQPGQPQSSPGQHCYNQQQQGPYGQPSTQPQGQPGYNQSPQGPQGQANIQQPGYPQQASSVPGGYGYPSQPPSGYPNQPPPSYSASGPPGSSSQPAYPNLGGQDGASAPPSQWPTAPSFNPNWREEEDKKSK
ncbi:WW domain-binding protein 2 [Fragariocoptes setiger]|uniref:WW domain-binding protein 2 n=1 Tax=Fragariocoptes setiger TaxID=1670756 RepID=A0ABQ7S5P8_9ACAR|nr:WW domain-binding protein 2 [Fragariocoptes setiger]